jgi:hypothetical protein
MKTSSRFRVLLVILAFSIFVFFWFEPLPYHTLSGDDIILLHDANTGVYASSFLDSWFQTHTEKYRPVFSVIFSILVKIFVEDYRAYFNVNLVLELINGLLVAYLGWLLSNRRWSVALLTGFMFLISRFSYHYVLQLWGLMEELAHFFLLMILLTLRQAYVKNQRKPLAWTLIFFFLIIFTHERYLLLVGFLCLAILVVPKTFPTLRSRLTWASLPAFIVGFNFIIKTFFTQSGFIAGRPLQTNFLAILSQIGTGLANIFGFNMGVDFLTGKDITETGLTGYFLGLFFSIPIVLLFLLYIRNNFVLSEREKLKSEALKLGLFLVLLGTLLLSASIAIQQELRWVYSSYSILLLGIAYLAGKVVLKNTKAYFLVAWLGLATLGVDVYYRGFLDNIYICANMDFTDAAKTLLIDKYKQDLASTNIYIIDSGNKNIDNWVFLDDYWFQLYSGLPELKINFIDGLGDIPQEVATTNNFLVFNLKPSALYTAPSVFEEVTPQARQFLADRQPGSNNSKVYLDLINKYQDGKINSTAKASTPTGQGVLLMNFKSPLAGYIGTSKSLTILSSFNYRYENLKIQPGSHLSFYAAKIYAIGDGARLYVDSKDESGQTQRIFSVELPPAGNNTMDWQKFDLPLTKDLPETVTLYFGVGSEGGTADADWVALDQLFIYS